MRYVSHGSGVFCSRILLQLVYELLSVFCRCVFINILAIHKLDLYEFDNKMLVLSVVILNHHVLS